MSLLYHRLNKLVVICLSTGFSASICASVLICQAEKTYTGRGWVPKVFEIEIASDRKRAEVIRPKSKQFGLIPFEKSFVGSSFWARGKGTVTSGAQKGTFYNYQLQLDFYDGDSRAKATMKQQGYYDIVQNYGCQSLQPNDSRTPSVAIDINKNIDEPTNGKSSFADLWKKNGGEILGKNAVQPTQQKEQAPKPELKDKQYSRPEIVQIDPRIDGKNGIIQFSVTNPQSVRQVIVGDTDVTAQGPNYLWSGYIPIGSSSITIRVIGKNGVTISRIVQLERTNQPSVATRNLPPINPTAGYSAKPNKTALAIIIGIEKYETIGPATYAERDASVFYDVAQEKFGIQPDNIKLILGQKATRLNLLETVRDWAKYKNSTGRSDIFMFYAGHGRTDDSGETAYLLPFNVRTTLIEESSLGLNEALETLADSTTGNVVAFIDACYSGGTRKGDSLVAGRPLIVVQKQKLRRNNITLFSASNEKQIAKVIDEVRHGAFSYALMRGLTEDGDQNKNKKITASELAAYIRSIVSRNVSNQTPEVSGAEWTIEFE